MSQSFSHTTDTHASAIRTHRDLFFQGDALARIFDFYHNRGTFLTNRDGCGLAARVPMNIGETFLNQTKDRNFRRH